MKIRSLPLLLLASTALGGTLAVPLSAQTPPVAPPAASPLPATPAPATTQPVPTQLDAVTTAATRTRRPLDDVPATVSVITTEDINRENMQDVRDLVRNEPGVTVGNNPFRAGFQNFLIRGIGGNRVLLMQDGMRMPDFPGLQHGRGHLHPRATRPRGHQARRDHPRSRLGALRLRRDRRRGGLYPKDPGDTPRRQQRLRRARAPIRRDQQSRDFTGAVRQQLESWASTRAATATSSPRSLRRPRPTNWSNNNFSPSS